MTRRYVGMSMVRMAVVWGLGVAVVVTLVVGLIWGNRAIAVATGVAAAMGAAFIGAGVRAEREDGTIEDDVAARGPRADV